MCIRDRYFGSRMKGNAAKVHREWGNELEGVYGFNSKAAPVSYTHLDVYKRQHRSCILH